MVPKTQLALIVLLMGVATAASAQPRDLVYDTRGLQRIPDVVAAGSSATHLYVLSESEGLLVYRTAADTLQWLYTSDGMASRGTHLRTDTRFGYLWGAGNRLSVLEPTALRGVYSSVELPARPVGAARAGTSLFVAGANGLLFHVSLESPEALDRVDTVRVEGLREGAFQDLIPFSRQLALLAGRTLYMMDVSGGQLTIARSERLGGDVTRLFDLDGTLHGALANGDFVEIRTGGGLRRITESANDPVVDAARAGSTYFLRTRAGRLLVTDADGNLQARRPNPESGNVFARVNATLWVSTYDRFGPVRLETARPNANAAPLRLAPIGDVHTTLPRPVLLSFELAEGDAAQVRFYAQSPTADLVVRGKGLYWQPRATHLGTHDVTVTAIHDNGRRDSTAFRIHVRNFNQPPRFYPIRPLVIVAGEPYALPVKAVDPDGTDADNIRYRGYDLPAGSALSERTGLFTWTPEARQAGEHRFRVVATDATGIQAEQEVVITVVRDP